jgi:hypothetical protein
MDIVDFTPDQTREWDEFVASHPLASYGHLSAQFRLAAVAGMANVSLVARDGRKICGLLPLFLTRHHTLRVIPVRELASGALFPAGPLVSPQLQGKAETRVLETLLAAVRARALTRNADRVLVTHPTVVGGQPAIVRFGYSPLLHHGYKPRHGVGLLLDLTQPVEQLASARRSGCRQSVNKAAGSGATAVLLTDRREWMACRDINVQTLGELAYSDAQMATIWDDFIAPGHAIAHVVRSGGVPAAVTVTTLANGSAYYWIGLNRKPAPVPGAGHLALWTAILDARERGCRYFELGSLDFENPRNIGISQFKQSFGGTPYQVIGAQLDVRRVKSASIALAEAMLVAARERRPFPHQVDAGSAGERSERVRQPAPAREPSPQTIGVG